MLGNLFGQQLKFKNNDVDTITFASGAGGMRGGAYTNYVIVYSVKDSSYTIFDYFDYVEKVSGNRQRLIKKKKQYKSYIGKKIDIKLLEELIGVLEKLDNKPKFEDLGLSLAEFQKMADLNAAKKIAKKYYADYQFDLRYTTAEKNTDFVISLQNRDTFNLYIKTRFDTTWSRVETNSFDYSAIRIKSDEFKYGISAVNTFRQPWTTGNRKYVNLKVSRLMAQIVPKNFRRKDAFDIKTIVADYVEWFMRKRGYRL